MSYAKDTFNAALVAGWVVLAYNYLVTGPQPPVSGFLERVLNHYLVTAAPRPAREFLEKLLRFFGFHPSAAPVFAPMRELLATTARQVGVLVVGPGRYCPLC